MGNAYFKVENCPDCGHESEYVGTEDDGFVWCRNLDCGKEGEVGAPEKVIADWAGKPSGLAPCPFCGSPDVEYAPVEDYPSYQPAVYCPGCQARTEWDECCEWRQEAVDLARALWNRRAPVTVPAAAKPSTCCPDEHLVPMHSTDTKLCTGCKTEKHWPLEPGQKRTY